ncbi:DUF4185 domain-containing protein [Streptomyces alkaliterrae]|uniref:DUF4185 domain-containing protein n=1 Tax=Streptomyces alkaliterrae TaxID=2213162 RepID=A0A5P0YP23_9ACTN|nr:DUF4185 domain-containing protein [Streptomyces alkaliterrae]MBB1257745.1 DUF4185 domain-containing protein [Streptomyces alkaliterrae]MQS01357.1 DUF4185 domain-containing protein [Streptomyces alkaliterrae]
MAEEAGTATGRAPERTDPSGPTRAATRRRGPLAALLAFLVLAALVLLVPGGEPPEEDCRPLRVSDWRPENALTEEFARYGDDNSRLDDWTGGDGSRSLPLPDGRTLWLSADTFLDEVQEGRSRDPESVWVRNAGLVMSRDGRLERTLLGDGPRAWFPGLATADGREVWRWPLAGVVEPRTPGSAEQVVRVLLWQREAGQEPWTFGVPRATEVATVSLPDLRVESIEPILDPADADPAARVLYGTAAVPEGRWTYVFGADERTAHGRASTAHVARVPAGALADPAAWRYWDGERWQTSAARSAPMALGRTAERGATNTYTVARHGGTWLLLTTDAGGPDGRGLTTVTSYWACGPQGPWHGPHDVLVPPLPPGSDGRALAYNPQAHPSFGDGGGLVLGYDVNVPQEVAAVHRDVALYRPRFVRLDLSVR